MKNIVKIVVGIIFLNALVASAQTDSILNYANKLSPGKRLDYLLKVTWKQRAQNPKLAIQLGKKAIALAKQMNDKNNLAKAYNFVGVIFRNTGNYDSSYAMYKKALKYAKEIKDSVQIAYSLNNIGGYYGYNHLYYLALENVIHAKNIFHKLNNIRGEAYCDIQLGLWYIALEQYGMALDFLNDAIKIRKKIGDEFGIAVAQSLINNIYYEQKKFDKVKHLSLILLKKFKRFKDKKGIGVTLGILGGVAYANGNYKQALAYRKQALKYLREINYPSGVVNNLSGLGLIYYKLGKTKVALAMLKGAITIARRYNYDKGLISAYGNLNKIYWDKKDFKKISFYHGKLVSLYDSLNRIEQKTRLEEFQKILKINELNNKNVQLKNELSKKKLIIDSFIIIAVIILIFTIVFYLQSKRLKREEKLLQESNAAKNKLFSIIAHDLKSPFSALLGYTEMMLEDFDDFSKEELKENISHIRNITQNLFTMVENLLHWARAQAKGITPEPEIVNLEEEINKVVGYFAQNAADKGLEIKKEVSPEIKAFCDVSLLQTVLRNLINNAIKFTRPGGTITISANDKNNDGEIIVTVEDTGIGMSQKQIDEILNKEAKSTPGTAGEKGTGLGIMLVKEMVKHNGGELFIESEEGKGTKISFTLPAVKED